MSAAWGVEVKVHFIGIGGTGMGALAGLLKAAGHEVRGSDGPLYPPMSTQLASANIPVFEGFAASNLEWGPDCVVVGNICRKDHVEVLAARERGVRLESFPSMLAASLLEKRRALVVAGTHGKTTTSSLLTWMLRVGERGPSWLIGGVPQNLTQGFHLGEGDLIVLEGDEYDTAFFDKRSKFLHYRPTRAIITSVEFDHADIFDNYEQVRDAFVDFVRLIPADGLLVVDAGNEGALEVARAAACEIATYKVLERGETPSAERATYCVELTSRPGERRSRFELYERGEALGEFSTLLTGHYNLANIAAAFAIARAEGCEIDRLREAIRLFRGVKRRQELLGVVAGVRMIQDFAHHPTAVDLTIKATRRRYPDHSLHVCFEPRSSSSRRDVFFAGYAKAFDAATRVYIAPVYAPERVPDGKVLDVAGLGAALRERGIDASAFDAIDDVATAVLERAAPGDTVLLLSSGSFGGLADRLLESLGDAVTFAQPEDIEAIDQLLVACGMATLRDPDQIESLVIRPSRERQEAGGAPLPALIGCVQLQLIDDRAFLFGLAVSPECRGEGLGWVLADSIMRRARTLGARWVHLIAGETADFFTDKLGFAEVSADELDPVLRGLSNFEAAYHEGATCMAFELVREGQ
ncbi:UDP-N-acetylmuramate:L-alanyl-gamma-D-glutamyl-meso-diaminopimelate ligase [Enhygromyxa salina]|uniref:UDP-N-acetylmuramate:L-alanyl-gamma-D-glutamyl-meso-diaminopimelate ligase n=1 Tax=Enhygromyxa salina TaxID=215803 RepID=A0A0C2D986_9BACT|nr:GNAT family N-acetyltransferase [Enhygromyxa salina]KIG19626.1 UDP-N-acetylmuramate:L-alanyl-gamma-D-glutamyl-meso-diaminopimelate ligase [Enhygromyxa salina]